VVREAGGSATQLDGSPPADRGSFVTTNAALRDEVLGLFATR
jgi:hypothetical protein